jgi:hypothetical protein
VCIFLSGMPTVMGTTKLSHFFYVFEMMHTFVKSHIQHWAARLGLTVDDLQELVLNDLLDDYLGLPVDDLPE